ncbi:MAG TPA: hypothetical protein GXZ47_07030 [Treponema sp.]|nr:hypothetical protein [Treponema sp.]
MSLTPISIQFPLQKIQFETSVSVQRLALDDMRLYGEILSRMMDSAQQIAEHSKGKTVNILI